MMAALTACAVGEGGNDFAASGCVNDSNERLDGIDWKAAYHVDMRIRQDSFSPMIVNMVENSPVVLRITNVDDDRHILRSSAFFRSVALDSIIIGDEVNNDPCIDAITVSPHSTVEVRLMPVREGHYDFEDSSILVSRLTLAAAVGVFVIESYQNYYIKPTAFTRSDSSILKKISETPGEEPEDTGPSLFDGETTEETPEDTGPSLFDSDEPEETPPDSAGSEVDPNIVVFDDPVEFQ